MRFGKFCPLALAWVGILLFAGIGHAACSDSSGCYGAGIGSDGLANTVVGGPYGNVVSYRFRAQHSGSLQQIHIYLIPNHAGYSAGTGGQLQVTVNSDDGTSAHNPSSTVLASYLLANPLAATPNINFPVFVFSTPPSLVQGQLYHIVFTNVDPNPTANYISVDALYYANPTTPSQPTISDIDFAELLGGPNGSWAPRKGYTPILELDYQDGFSELNGYMEVWIGAPQNISGSSAVRETITVSSAQENVASVSIRVARVSGSDPLIITLENGDGTMIEQGQISADQLPSANSDGWVTYSFSSAHTLIGGLTYHLQLTSAASSTYQEFPIRKGLAYGFRNTTYFPDGYAQFYQSGSWVGWTQWGVSNRTDSDLQFYFGLATSNPAPTISNVGNGSVTSNSATITWATDQASTSQVEYGTTTAYGNISAVNLSNVTAHSQTLTNLLSATGYHFRVYSANASGNQTVSGDLTFTTLPPVVSAPVISGIAAGAITSSSATITWTTDQASSSQVEYGLTTAYGNITAVNLSDVTAHSQTLTNLLSATGYHFRVYSANASGNQTVSGDLTFTTLPPVVSAPVISGIAAGTITSSSATITWTTDQASSSQVEYGLTTAYGNISPVNTNNVTSHSQVLNGLSAAMIYHYRVYSMNATGNQTVSSDFTFTTLPQTVKAPTISGITVSSITSSSATISWTTDQPSTSQIQYGTSTAYGKTTTLNSTLLTKHSQSLGGLSSNTRYHFRVLSKNSAGMQATSADFTFVTHWRF